MPVFVSNLDTLTYKSFFTAARLLKVSEMLHNYTALHPGCFCHCDLIREVTRGHQRSQNWTFADKSCFFVGRLPKLVEMLHQHIALLPVSFCYCDLICKVARGHQRSHDWTFAHILETAGWMFMIFGMKMDLYPGIMPTIYIF